MPVALPTGAIADMFNRRKVTLVAMTISLIGSILLTLVTVSGLLQPTVLLVLCFLIGSGPAWQASVSEQVPPGAVPTAIAPNWVSYNIAHSFGPDRRADRRRGGCRGRVRSKCLALHPAAAAVWRRVRDTPRLPPERLGRAITSGMRYLFHSPPLRTVLPRTLLTGLAGGSLQSLMSIVARDLIGGQAETYGLILGALGIGAIMGALRSLLRASAKMMRRLWPCCS